MRHVRAVALALLLVAAAGCAPITRIFIEFEAPPTPDASEAPVVTPAPTAAPTHAPTTEPEPSYEPITFTDITVEEVGPDYAIISWSVDPPAQGWIEYGTDTNYGSETKRELTLLGFHRQRVSGLQPETTYHFRIIALIPDPAGGEPVVAMAVV